MISKPQIRMLDYMHVSSKHLLSDSNFYLHRDIFKYINRHYPGQFYFHTTYETNPENDKIMKRLAGKCKNVQPIPMEYFSTNAFFRNSLDWKSISKKLADVDIVWCNTPEINFELSTFLAGKGLYVPLMCYQHWPSNLVRALFANFANYQSERFCLYVKQFYNFFLAHRNYCSSKHGVKLLNDTFSQLPGKSFTEEMKAKVKPLYLTIDHEEIDRLKPSDEEIQDYRKSLNAENVPIIIFNSRHNTYTGFTFFMEAIQKIIQMRPALKFKIFLSCVGEHDRSYKFKIPDEYYVKKETLSYPEYVKMLWTADVQIGAHTGVNQWSLSFIDGMFTDNIPLYNKGHFFDEMFQGIESHVNNYGYLTEEEFIEKFVFMLENLKNFKNKNEIIYNHFRQNWTWDTLIHRWADSFIDTYNSAKPVITEKFEKLNLQKLPESWIKIKNIIDVSDQRPISAYRQVLKNNYPVKEDMQNEKSIFYREDQPIKKTRGFFND